MVSLHPVQIPKKKSIEMAITLQNFGAVFLLTFSKLIKTVLKVLESFWKLCIKKTSENCSSNFACFYVYLSFAKFPNNFFFNLEAALFILKRLIIIDFKFRGAYGHWYEYLWKI